MNIFQRICAALGREYVVLNSYDGMHYVRRAYRLGSSWFAHPYLPETRARLHPGGRLDGRCYLTGWEPITDGIRRFYQSA